MKVKVIISIFLGICTLIACTPKESLNPTDLEGLKTMLSSKNQELSNLKKEIASLEEQINGLTTKDQIKKTLVTIDTIAKQTFKQFTEVQAFVAAEDFVNASSEVGGLLTGVFAKEGDYVKRGKLIASVDMSPMEDQLKELKTSYSLANTIFERQERLWKQNIGSELQFLEAKSNKERLEQSISAMENTLKKKHIYAPISGFVDREFLNPGEIAGPGMPVVNILNTSKLKLVADVPENYLGTVNKGDIVEIYFPAIDLKTSAKVNMLGRSIDPSNRTFKLELDVSKYAKEIKPNLLAKVNLNNYSNPEAIALQTDLVQKDVSGKSFVYTAVLDSNEMVARQVLVSTGKSYDNQIEITSGLKEDDLIIVKGARSVNNGNPLTIQNEQ